MKAAIRAAKKHHRLGLGNPKASCNGADRGSQPGTNPIAGPPRGGPQPQLRLLQLARVGPREVTAVAGTDHSRIPKAMCQTEREIRAKAPKRPYRNFVEFCLCRTHSANRLTPGRPFYPCLIGGGREPELMTLAHPCWTQMQGTSRCTLECEGCKGSRKRTQNVLRGVQSNPQQVAHRNRALPSARQTSAERTGQADQRAENWVPLNGTLNLNFSTTAIPTTHE